MEPMTLTTRRLLLRPFRPGDAEAVFTACQDPAVQRWTTVPSPYEREHAETYVTRICPDGWRNDTGYNFAVTARDGGELVGAMGLVRLNLGTAARVAELGYWTAKEQRGHGFTSEAARAVARWTLEDLGVERLEWFAETGNSASRAVALNAGFRMEGTLRAKIVHRGVRRDAWAGSLLPSDLGLESATAYRPSDGGVTEAAPGVGGGV